MCGVLRQHGIPIGASNYYEWVAKSPTRAQRRDEDLLAIITAHRQQQTVAGLGARKMWLRLRRHGVDVARCTVERLNVNRGEGARYGKSARHESEPGGGPRR